MKQPWRIGLLVASVLLLGFAVGCQKKTPVAAVPPVPKAEVPEATKPPAPTIVRFGVEPGNIIRGQSATLGWEVRDATQVQIDRGLGSVEYEGQRTVSPDEPTSYTLRARGPGGETSRVAALNVTVPPPPPAAAVAPAPGFRERVASDVHDAYFDFDRSTLRADAREVLTKDGEALQSIFRDFATYNVIVEGHCDERGSAEYNMALGDRRVTEAKNFLGQLGVPADRMVGISYGKERPQCTESDERCWQLNRRVHFAPGEDQRKTISQLDWPSRP
jgi:peptidoglycan-associated lipoprotein